MAGRCTLAFTDSGFDQEVLQSDIPSRQIAPTVEAVACDYSGKMKIGRTLLLFKSGQVVDQREGAIGRSELSKMIEPHL